MEVGVVTIGIYDGDWNNYGLKCIIGSMTELKCSVYR